MAITMTLDYVSQSSTNLDTSFSRRFDTLPGPFVVLPLGVSGTYVIQLGTEWPRGQVLLSFM